MSDLRQCLRETGHRVTPQREAVFAALCEDRGHPTAEDLFLAVREHLPSISFATVYNTLEALCACALVRKLPGAGSARYEVATVPHGHARCVRCGAVEDLPSCEVQDLLKDVALPAGFFAQVTTLFVDGLCAHCMVLPRAGDTPRETAAP